MRRRSRGGVVSSVTPTADATASPGACLLANLPHYFRKSLDWYLFGACRTRALRRRVGSSAAGGASSALGWSGEPEAAAPAVGDAVAGRRDVAESVACGFTRGDPATGPHAIGTVGGVVSTDAVGAGCACG
ncbi:hypothetical protein MRX96_016940 [Rhipicephalus microplus]